MIRFAIAAAALFLAAPAMAKVHETSPSGFVIQLGIDVSASPKQSWEALISPKTWWNAEHSYSRDSSNLSLDPRAGGCFCEILPSKISPNAAPRGSVEHMRIVYAEEPRALRMSGALGPLQSDAGTGTLTVILKPEGSGTRILWEYVYGGYVRGEVPAMAAAVDAMMTEQVLRLGKLLGARPVDKAEAVEPKPAEATESDFIREMEAGIGEATDPQDESRASTPGLSPTPPDKPVNDQGFIGR